MINVQYLGVGAWAAYTAVFATIVAIGIAMDGWVPRDSGVQGLG
jgi:hypothetical protein